MTIFHRLRRSAPACRGAIPIVRQGHLALGGIIMPGERLAIEEDLRQIPIDRFPYVPLDLVNNAGVDLVAGDVLAVSTIDSSSVVANDFVFTRSVYVVAQESIRQGAPGRFAVQGVTLAKAPGTIAIGEYVQKSTARGVAGTGRFKSGSTPNLPPPDGALGHAVEASADGFVRCFWYGVPESTFTLANLQDFYEDFETGPAFSGAIGATEEQWRYRWARASGADAQSPYGVMRVSGDANAPSFALRNAGVYTTPFNPLTAPLVLEMRFAQRGVAAGTRRLGLSALAIGAADPANGIYARFTVGGNIFIVFRAGGVESTVDTTFVAADGVMNTMTAVYDGAAGYVLANGTRTGNPVTTNIPLVAMGLSGGNSVGTVANGFDLDAISVRHARAPVA